MGERRIGDQTGALRIWLILLILFVSLTSLTVGLLVAVNPWLLLAVLAVVDVAALAWLHFRLLRRLECDLDRRRQAEGQLRRHADQVEDLYNHAPCGYHSLDSEGRFVRINDTALSWLGYSREEIIGRPFLDFLTPASRAGFIANFPEFKQRGWVRDVEFQLVRKDGTILHGLLSSVAQRDEAGHFLMSRSTFIDLTERKRYEERLTDLSLRLQAVLDAATSMAIIATDLDGRITLFNAGAERMLGYRAAEMVGLETPCGIHLPSELQAQGERLSREFGRPLHGFDVLVERVRHGGCEEREWTCVRKDGSHLTAHVVVTGLRSVEGRLTGFLCVAADVTERNRARERLRMTMEAARIGTWDWDITLDRCSWSDNIHSILGVRRAADEMKFTDALEAIFPEDRDRVRAAVESALRDPDRHDLYEAEFRTLGSDGQVRWIEDKGRVFRDAEGVPRHMMGTVMDITERKRADEALRQARDEAESANQAKSSFLASLSHEIRTPLGAIIGLIELLQHGAASAEQRGQLQTMATAADTLLALINDVLDITKIEAGKLELEALDFDIRELINNVVEVLSPAARHKELSVRVAVSEAVPARLVGDPGRLRQVLMNLVNNAIKFTRRGEVSVHVETEDRGSRMEDRKDRSDSSSILVRFTVKDTGIGIDADKLEAIFQPFTQADPSTTRRHGGTGLGLTISSRLVERMGGRIHVESDPGRGSSFWFRLLLPIASKGVAPPVVVPPAPSDGPALRVLLAEDNPVNQQVLTLMLERAGHRVAIANNGREALEALERDDYHLVLMDVQMPEMDGLRCTKLIRQHEKASGRHVPIVAVTANAMQGERQRCLQAGMDDYLAKPVRGHELAGVIARLLGRSTPLGEQAETRLPDERGPAWLVSLRDMGFDEEGITRLTRTFLDTVPGRMEMLRKAVAARDAEQVHKTAHTLKGSLAVFAIQPAQAAAMRLMVLAQQQQRDGFATALAELEAEVGPLLESMRRVMVESPGGVSER